MQLQSRIYLFVFITSHILDLENPPLNLGQVGADDWRNQLEKKLLGIYMCISVYSLQYIIIKTDQMSFKRLWNQQEDQFIREQVNKNNNKDWVNISKQFNLIFKGQPRTAKQCRQRYINHASTSLENPFQNNWTLIDQNMLFELYEQNGPKWTLIAQKFSNKSQNIVKNKFYCSLRKFVRKLNRVLKSIKNKYKKQIRYQSVTRVLQAYQNFTQMPEDLKSLSLVIRKKILLFTQMTIHDSDVLEDQLINIAENINKFNLQTRSYKAKKPKNIQNQNFSQTMSVQSSLKAKNDQPEKSYENKDDPKIVSSRQDNLELIRQQDSQYLKQGDENGAHKSFSCLSEQELFDNFGVILKQNENSKVDNQQNILKEMFPQAFPVFQIQGCDI